MADEPIDDLLGFDLNNSTAEQRDAYREFLEGVLSKLSGADDYAQAVGDLCASWAWLDRSLDALFEPLLDCPAEQVACILIENTEARCAMIERLLHTVPVPDDWRAWIVGLITRVRGEIGPRRNRIVHDAWILDADSIKRIRKGASLAAAQAHQPKTLRYDVEHDESADAVNSLIECTFTVTQALRYAHHALVKWRAEGQFRQLDPRWLPASERNARCKYLQSDPEDPEQQLLPAGFSRSRTPSTCVDIAGSS